ncbi:recombination protein RecO [Campylobacter fetus]|uniref:Recombination protein RecO n=3 Tax=Campylobacter fetus TaxID=196 RepID=A0A5L8JYS1_CAMFE|nr:MULTISPECIES: recombination protein RecO [Campylobacter]OCS22954.1 recombination protein RecO [Campylobacter fetus subsp. venerealis cfvi97/532]OCS27150.1 recombination protein RecO [Campylobacter fetus subsp. venerealis cfvB10]OCS30254.1 recombination protein RecO [Campylobacter fetus subsp. venerealis LMG 6570 = CCUG 33900]OCS41619.1 recombination protein RecO [Campylobacter fetus subsp. venerealis cfvi02/298]ABK82214.1 conserved hypothetical protein [Campylobacter fetus subsp. fetus 82-4
MQGYILKVQKVRDEDCLVFILSKDKLIKCYRFYGARHPVITQGFKLDFELVQNGNFLPHLRGTMHLGFSWLFHRDRLLAWQNFMRLLYEHLRDVEDIDEFYYSLLELCSYKFEKQNPKRIIIEAYLDILEFEGRLHKDLRCFVCDEIIDSNLTLTRGFLPAHKRCIGKAAFDSKDIKTLFETKKCSHINDFYIDQIYYIVLEGL